MSCDFNAFFVRADLPAIAVLRAHLERAGNRVVIVDDVDFLTAEGWIDVNLDGTSTGFEVYSEDITDDSRGTAPVSSATRRRPIDSCVSSRTATSI